MFNKPRSRNFSGGGNNSIDSLPFEELAETCNFKNYEQIVEEWSNRYALKLKTWVYPQALARVGKWTLSRNESGLFSGKELIVKNCKTDEVNKGLYWFLMCDSRQLNKQYQQTEYCSMVPLILSAFKKFHNIEYSQWDREELHYVVSPKLLEAMTTVPPDYSVEELLQFRVKGLTMGTGSRNPGHQKSPVTTYNLHHLPKQLEDGRVGPGHLPPLTRMMLCQTWCAHPSNRSKYMITNPLDWDNMPAPLVDSEIINDDDHPLSGLDDIWK